MTHREKTVRYIVTLLNFMKQNRKIWDEAEERQARKILYRLYDEAYGKKEKEVQKADYREYYYGR